MLSSLSAFPIEPVHAGTPFEQHAVQFYDSDEFLCTVVADYLGHAFAARGPMIVIATQDHRDAFLDTLVRRGQDVARAVATGHLQLYDARTTVDQLLVDGMPD